MDDVTRRDVLKRTGTAGALAALAASPDAATAAASGKRKAAEPAEGEVAGDAVAAADRRRVLAVGMTEAEADCWALAAELAGKFFNLPKLHPSDDVEVAQAIHLVQNKLLGRPTYRLYLDMARKEQAADEAKRRKGKED